MLYREDTGVPAGSAEIDVDGVRLAVAREGSGPAVVCLHAIGHGGRDFEALAAALKHRFEVIRIDWPGQGRSGADSERPSAARYADLLGGVITRLNIHNPIIIGNSIGGTAAMIYASRNPVRALVLCDSGGLVEVSSSVRRLCALFARFFAAGEKGARWYAIAFRAYYRFLVLPAKAAQAQRERIIRAGYETAGLLRMAWEGFGRPEADLRNLATSLQIPVWLAWAKGDKVIPLRYCMACIREMKNATLTTFSGGHAAFLEQPEAFIAEFIRFADSLDQAAAPVAEDRIRCGDAVSL